MLILDEPTSGVDPMARDQFWKLLIDLSRNQGVTIFISTHFMNEAARCDRIALMDAGRVLATGTPADLTRSGRNQQMRQRQCHRPFGSSTVLVGTVRHNSSCQRISCSCRFRPTRLS